MPLLSPSTPTFASVICDDLRHQLIIQGRRLSLRPQIYFLARALILQGKAYEAGQTGDRLVSHKALCRETGATSMHALHALASEAGAELCHCLLIINKYGQGYHAVLLK